MTDKPRKPKSLSKKLQAQARARKSAQSKANPKIGPMSVQEQEKLLNQLSDADLEKLMKPVTGKGSPAQQPMKMEIGGDLIGDAGASEFDTPDIDGAEVPSVPPIEPFSQSPASPNAGSVAQQPLQSPQFQTPPVEFGQGVSNPDDHAQTTVELLERLTEYVT